MQHLPGLVNLRALNIIHFRNDDTCVWVMRETRKFIVDNLSHYPNLKLEWISVDDDKVDHILRASDMPKKADGDNKKKKDKGKAKATTTAAVALSSAGPSDLALLPPEALESDTESEDEVDNASSKLKLGTMDGVHFYDVWGVRIFKKEVMAGRL
jgi:hypothetical protein